MRWLRNPRIVLPGAAVVLAAAAWLAFGYFAVHLLWVDDKVDEALPTFDATATTSPLTTSPQTTLAVTSLPVTAPVETSAPPTGAPNTAPPITPPPLTTPPLTTPPSTVAAIVEEASGTFVSLDHDTSGRAVVLGNGTDQRFLRFEDFSTSNGPDVNIYLVNSSAGGVTDYVDLGDMKGNVGDQNYEIPAGVDLAVYDRVLLWCVRFSSPFGEALLT
jgi:hypothetical protein